MREFQQRRIFRRLMYSKISIFFLSIIFIFFAFSVAGVYRKSKEASQKNNEVKSELNELKAKKDYLENEINRLNTNIGVEEELRDKFQVAKPGEKVIIILDDNKVDTGEAKSKNSDNWFWRLLGR